MNGATLGAPARARRSARAGAIVVATAWLLLAGCSTPRPGQPDTVAADAPPRESVADTVRLLEQSSFGPTPEAVERVRRQGFARYLDEQFRLATSAMPELPVVGNNVNQQCGAAGADATPEVRACRRENYSQLLVQTRFFQNALTQPDQLRQRVAFALGQVFVVSARKNNRAYAMARYQQLLLDHAFGNYRSLLEAVTLSPMMGQYLDMANNARQDAQRGVPPNENYAREVLQLFSVGLVQLNPDGSPKRGADGRPLPTYGAPEVAEFARAFTGWTYAAGTPASGGASAMPVSMSAAARRNPPRFDAPLVPAPGLHDAGPKTLLGGQRMAGSADPRVDLAAALDNIFQHPNVGPFIGRRLIQHLTTSNPSPAYVARVAAAFADNGRGVRGDLQAVVRAILLDPEARGDAPAGPQFGKLREPVLYVTGVMRALGAQSDGVDLIGQSAGMAQNVFVAPSVFNFFPPDYELTGEGMATNAPELAIVDSNTSLKRAEFAWRLIFGRPVPPDPTLPAAVGATGTTLSLAAWEPLAAEPGALVDRLDALLLHNSLPAPVRGAIVQAVQAVPAANPAQRVKTAAYLMVAGPQYQVQR
jgi:uncharacterized protein (DUF1800 family)